MRRRNDEVDFITEQIWSRLTGGRNYELNCEAKRMAEDDKAKERDRLIEAKKAAIDAELASSPGAADNPQKSDAPQSAAEPDPAAGARAARDPLRDDFDEAPPEEPPSTHDEPEHEETQSGRSVSSILLQWIVIFVIGAAAALWAGPRIAPMLPGWAAPVADFLTPGADRAEQAMAEMEADTRAQFVTLTDRIGALETSAEDNASAGVTDQVSGAVSEAVGAAEGRLNERIDQLAEAAPGADTRQRVDDLSSRVSELETTISGLRAELNALTSVSDGDAAPSSQVLERVAAFGAAVEGLRGEIAEMRQQTAKIDTLATDESVDALGERVTALEGGEAATAGARNDAESIRRAANLDAALTRIGDALPAGAPYQLPMNEAVSLSGEPAPDPLASLSEGGAPSVRDLSQSFPDAAQRAYSAALESDAGEGFGNRFLAKLEGRLGGRPATETEGSEPGAVLSRMEARLREGELEAVSAEAEGLPEAAVSAMSGWLDQLRAAAAARRSFDDWRAALDVK